MSDVFSSCQQTRKERTEQARKQESENVQSQQDAIQWLRKAERELAARGETVDRKLFSTDICAQTCACTQAQIHTQTQTHPHSLRGSTLTFSHSLSHTTHLGSIETHLALLATPNIHGQLVQLVTVLKLFHFQNVRDLKSPQQPYRSQCP